MKMIKKLMTIMIVSILLVSSSNFVSAEEGYTNKKIIGIQEDGNIKIIQYVEETPIQTITSSKNISFGWDVVIDNVFSYTLKQDITFAYGIPTNAGEKAQIITAKAYISKTNSSSAYYPDTSTLSTKIVKLGNPATVTSKINTIAKSTNKLHGTLTGKTFCYGNGSYK